LSFIQGLHGVVAIVLLCTLLFAEEAGVPLPAPGELTLIVAGLLIATGGLDPWFFVPLAIASCVAGSLAGTAGHGSLASTASQRPPNTSIRPSA
jgi:membrane protein DedA with SNARE-associated domain